jgi:hypothetical protein
MHWIGDLESEAGTSCDSRKDMGCTRGLELSTFIVSTGREALTENKGHGWPPKPLWEAPEDRYWIPIKPERQYFHPVRRYRSLQALSYDAQLARKDGGVLHPRDTIQAFIGIEIRMFEPLRMLNQHIEAGKQAIAQMPARRGCPFDQSNNSSIKQHHEAVPWKTRPDSQFGALQAQYTPFESYSLPQPSPTVRSDPQGGRGSTTVVPFEYGLG